MRYPDQIKIYFRDPKRKINPEKFKKLQRGLLNFGRVLVSRSTQFYMPRGIDYKIIEEDGVEIYNNQLIVKLERQDLDKD